MASLEGANAFFEGTLREAAWSVHGDTQKQAAIKDAERTMLALGLHSPPQQAVDWAVYEQAYCLLEMPEEATEQQRNIAMGLTSVTVDKHSESYGDASAVAGLVGGVWVCPEALRWVEGYLTRRRVRTGSLRWDRGRCL